MKRLTLPPRPNWISKAESVGFTYHSLGKSPESSDGVYWCEEHAYEFESAEIDAIEAATNELHRLCMKAVAYAVSHPHEMRAFRIPRDYYRYVIHSWERQSPHWMGRFDLAYDPDSGSIKLLEYNADTPTLVIETALVQWYWLQDVFPGADQFNLLHEMLLERLTEIWKTIWPGEPLYFAGLLDYPEEAQHIRYFMDLATQAGIECRQIAMKDIGWHFDLGYVDMEMRPIRVMHKLYPWEWMAQEPFGRLLPAYRPRVIEPPWKMLLSNKALLPLLWKLFPDHPNLLAAGWAPEDVGPHYVAKPILAREGANIELRRPGHEPLVTGGSYADSPKVYQDIAPLPYFDGQHVVLGSWVVGDKAAGMIIREDASPVVVNTSKVVPHLFR